MASLHADFQRAVERGNVARAEAAARQLGRLPLADALKLLLLYAEKEPAKFERAALRWHARYVSETRGMTLMKAQIALMALSDGGEAARVLLMQLVSGEPPDPPQRSARPPLS